MIAAGVIQISILMITLVLLAYPLGRYMAACFSEGPCSGDAIFLPIERWILRMAGVKAEVEMNWKGYASALIIFNALGALLFFVILLLQENLPFNPEGLDSVPIVLAFNTAVSFTTNTNWQAYAGENTMSYFSQMTALTVQNFLSAGTGLAVAIAFIRGIVRQRTDQIGNFWMDITRAVIRILVPLAVIMALLLLSQGVIQNLKPYETVTTMEGARQVIAMGPVASQEAIKIIGTNGGGFFNANSAHPFENPNPISNFLEILGILLIPAALTATFGTMSGNRRQGTVLLAAMILLFLAGFGATLNAETYGNPLLAAQGISAPTAMEGKEMRFGPVDSSMFALATTAASCGAVNEMHDSMTPLGALAPLLFIMMGEVIFGGIGSGFYGILIFVIITVFIIGLMVGRTPEYIGKKIESWDIKMATLAILVPSAFILLGTVVAIATGQGDSSVLNAGPHGFTEMIYAFASASGNNGSAFAGLNANSAFWNFGLAFAMIAGRFGVIVPVLAIAGNLAGKQSVPLSAGSFDTGNGLFPFLLAAVIFIVGALTFFPSLALGPIVEHLMMISGGA